MTSATTRRDLQQSLLEGIALQSRQVIAVIERAANIGNVLSVDGGLSASDYFLQFFSDVTNKIIRRAGSTELTAYGCASLAAHPIIPVSGMTQDTYYHPSINEREVASRVDRYEMAMQAAIELGGRTM
jgi:glycerol kinase